MLCYAGPHGLGVRPGKNCVGLTMVYWIEGHMYVHHESRLGPNNSGWPH